VSGFFLPQPEVVPNDLANFRFGKSLNENHYHI